MSAWTWSAEHNRYFRWITNTDGTQTCEWAQPPGQAAAPQPAISPAYAPIDHTPAPTVPGRYASSSSRHARNDSVAGVDVPPPVPHEERVRLPRFIAGTPEAGMYDSLDPSYRMRTGSEAHQFFKKGRVFATLYTEPTGETSQHSSLNPAYTTVRFGASVYTQIRRFVIVSVRRHFVYAVAIATYGQQGTLKPGCSPGEHAVIYNTGIDPRGCYLAGEVENGLYKDPIEVYPADSSSYLTRWSRIRFGKAYAIEWNVKVKDFGTVMPHHIAKLIGYYEDEDQEAV